MSDPLLDAIDAAVDAAGAFHDALVDVRAAVANGSDDPPGGDPEPGELAPPADFAATWDPNTRRVTCQWTAQDDAVQIHESATDPENTLKETLPAGVTIRVSSPLKGGHDYVWGACSVRGDEVSEFTPWVAIAVPLEGGEVEDPDEGEDPDEEEPDDEEPAPGGPHPSDVLPILRHWTIMLPTGSPGDPDNEYVVGRSVADTYFTRQDEHGLGVVFRTHPATACHSKNSRYGRTEGRQMEPPPAEKWTKSGWPSGPIGLNKDPAEPQHLHAVMRIDASRLAHPIVNSAQIHDGSDDVMQIQSRDGVLGIAHEDGDAWEVIDPNYGTDGPVFELDIKTTGTGEIVVDYNGAEAARIEKSGTGWYWKSGSYPNTGGANTDRVEDPAAYAEVVIYELDVVPA